MHTILVTLHLRYGGITLDYPIEPSNQANVIKRRKLGSGGEKIECSVGGSCEGRQPATLARNVKVCTRKLYCF